MMLNDSLKMMENRLSRQKQQLDSIQSLNKKIKAIDSGMKSVVIQTINKDYPQLVSKFRKGEISYSMLLELYNKLEEAKYFQYYE